MPTYRIEVTHGQDMREVTAEAFATEGDWLIFYRNPPQGGRREYWRIRTECVVCMETKP